MRIFVGLVGTMGLAIAVIFLGAQYSVNTISTLLVSVSIWCLGVSVLIK